MRYIKLLRRDMSLYKTVFTRWFSALYVAGLAYLSLHK